MGKVDHEKEVLETKKQTLFPHAVSNINLPDKHMSKIHTEKAALLHNCLFTRYSLNRRIPLIRHACHTHLTSNKFVPKIQKEGEQYVLE